MHRVARIAVTNLVACLIVLVAGPAFAEGSFTSYMRGWLTGVETQLGRRQHR